MKKQSRGSCHTIIAPLPKLGTDEIAYINLTVRCSAYGGIIPAVFIYSSAEGPEGSRLMQIQLFYPVYSGKR